MLIHSLHSPSSQCLQHLILHTEGSALSAPIMPIFWVLYYQIQLLATLDGPLRLVSRPSCTAQPLWPPLVCIFNHLSWICFLVFTEIKWSKTDSGNSLSCLMNDYWTASLLAKCGTTDRTARCVSRWNPAALTQTLLSCYPLTALTITLRHSITHNRHLLHVHIITGMWTGNRAGKNIHPGVRWWIKKIRGEWVAFPSWAHSMGP